MNSRERVAALLSHQIPDQMGLFEHFWPETTEKFWPAQGFPAGADTSYCFDYDCVYCTAGVSSEPFLKREEVIEEDDRRRLVRDGRGATLRYWKEKSGTPEHVAFEVTSPEKWKIYREPLLETDRNRLGDMPAWRAQFEAARAKGKAALTGTLAFFEVMRAMLGDQVFLPALLTDPDWIRDICEVYLDFFRRHFGLLYSEVGPPDVIIVYEDFGFRNGLFASPDLLREAVMPFEKELVGFFKDHGVAVILHSCGDIRRGVPLFIDAGFDCLQPMEAKAGCDVVELAKTYGDRLAYMGNIDVRALETNDMATVRQEIEAKVYALKKLRVPYFFHSDHSIPPTVHMNTYRGALEIFESMRDY